MDILFLDANILFSAAYREKAGVTKFWELSNAKIITSNYAFEEAKRNLSNLEQLKCIETLMQGLDVYTTYDTTLIPHDIKLKDKDRPILAAAIGAKANYLITGDFADFDCFYEKSIYNVLIVSPTIYLQKYYKEK